MCPSSVSTLHYRRDYVLSRCYEGSSLQSSTHLPLGGVSSQQDTGVCLPLSVARDSRMLAQKEEQWFGRHCCPQTNKSHISKVVLAGSRRTKETPASPCDEHDPGPRSRYRSHQPPLLPSL
ncbi:unnamed protein product [Pleuronectes platessa]|uniref:Uncharacterized protein n=1 Tax=Pleuronectes platessa TaxID=8262 RepID=A0A9N7VD00_PLEPL|nr:unnamed protein product [Pleuronectes platessa]